MEINLPIQFRTNQAVETPRGRGVVQSQFTDNGHVLVRLPFSGSPTDSRCWTPHAAKSSLWVFPPGDLKSLK